MCPSRFPGPLIMTLWRQLSRAVQASWAFEAMPRLRYVQCHMLWEEYGVKGLVFRVWAVELAAWPPRRCRGSGTVSVEKSNDNDWSKIYHCNNIM